MPRIAVVGIGHELRGDDAAGLAVANDLQRTVADHDHILILAAGPAPENFTGILRRFAPDLVILVDAALMDTPPGSVRLLDWQDTTGFSASTHTLPPSLLADYLVNEIGCQVVLIGIQPADNTLEASLSSSVKNAVAEVEQILLPLLAIQNSQ